LAWATLTPEDLWKLINEEAQKNYGFELNWYGDSMFKIRFCVIAAFFRHRENTVLTI